MHTKKLIVIFPDQLSTTLSSLKLMDSKTDSILMMEVMEEFTFVKHHQKKIAFILSCMRHFAKELKNKKLDLHYIQLDQPESKTTYTKTVQSFLKKHPYQEIIVTHPGDFRLIQEMKKWPSLFSIPVQIVEDDRFFCTIEEFKTFFKDKQHYLMENFYRLMRKKTSLLMKGGKPIGGKFNFDKENRNPIKARQSFTHFEQKPDAITKEVMKLVSSLFSSHFGEISPFYFATTRKDAITALNYFIDHHLPTFGTFQDSMQENEPFLHHSVISMYLNIGLLTPREVCEKVEKAFHEKQAPINSVEGYIRQILGWREYIRGIYWTFMPEYKKKNELNAMHKLPFFYWDGNCKMNCIRQVVQMTHKYAYSHHIQRLMITGNFALLCGIDPKEVCEWYLIVYADAFDWVELPNTLGMSLYGDGGLLATKPYCSSGSYINKMSNFCKNCFYDVEEKLGEKACPFNYLYWNFLIKHEKMLKSNPRLGMAYNLLKKMDKSKKKEIQKEAEKFISSFSHKSY